MLPVLAKSPSCFLSEAVRIVRSYPSSEDCMPTPLLAIRRTVIPNRVTQRFHSPFALSLILAAGLLCLPLSPGAIAATPTIVSSPYGGANWAYTFPVLINDSAGTSDIYTGYFLIGSSFTWPNQCQVTFWASGGQYYVALLNNAGNAWTTAGVAGQSGSASNGQCTLYASASTIYAQSATTLRVNFCIDFVSGYGGLKSIWTYAEDNEGEGSGWLYGGTWNVANDSTPTVVSVVPSSGAGSRQTFTATLSDPDGQADVAGGYFLLNSSFSWPNGCQIAMDRYDGIQVMLYLLEDNGSTWSGPISPGSGSLSNSQCTLYGATSSVSPGSGNQVQVNMDLGFSSTFCRSKEQLDLRV